MTLKFSASLDFNIAVGISFSCCYIVSIQLTCTCKKYHSFTAHEKNCSNAPRRHPDYRYINSTSANATVAGGSSKFSGAGISGGCLSYSSRFSDNRPVFHWNDTYIQGRCDNHADVIDNWEQIPSRSSL